MVPWGVVFHLSFSNGVVFQKYFNGLPLEFYFRPFAGIRSNRKWNLKIAVNIFAAKLYFGSIFRNFFLDSINQSRFLNYRFFISQYLDDGLTDIEAGVLAISHSLANSISVQSDCGNLDDSTKLAQWLKINCHLWGIWIIFWLII